MSVYGCFQQETNHAYVYLSLRHEPWGRPRFGDFVLCYAMLRIVLKEGLRSPIQGLVRN